MTDSWWPDLATLHWALANVDEPGVADSMVFQLVQRFPQIATIDRALLGEAAAESVLFMLLDMARLDSARDSQVL